MFRSFPLMFSAVLVLLSACSSVAPTGVRTASTAAQHTWPAPRAPAVPAASGFVVIPDAHLPPDPSRTYRAVFDGTRAAAKPTEIVPVLDMAGSEVNAFAVARVPARNVELAIVFHGAAIDALLDDAHYQAKYGVANPNLAVLRDLRKAGVELFVCGQNLAFDGVDPKTLSPDVAIASDALLVLIDYQNRGFALLGF
jgi:intracellular sulfur oxidation DsrE/DsrF family protein